MQLKFKIETAKVLFQNNSFGTTSIDICQTNKKLNELIDD